MRIAIIGAGAMGSLFASHLAGIGLEVWAYDIWREHVDAIRRDGLIVRRDGAERSTRMNATTDPREVGLCDVALVFVKCNQTRAAMEGARPMIGDDTIVVTLQNGIGNVEIIRSLLPKSPLIFGLTTLTCELVAPGLIEASYKGPGETYLWPDRSEPLSAVERVAAALTDGGINAMPAPDIEVKIWKKLIVNCCLNTMCAIAGKKVGEIADVPEVWPFLDGVVDEILAVASCKNIDLDRDEAHSFLRSVAEEARFHEPSMLIDVRNGRVTEIECLNGAILRESARFGVPAPCNRALYTMIRVIEQTAGKRDH